MNSDNHSSARILRLASPLLLLVPTLAIAQGPLYSLVGNHGSGKQFGASIAIVGDVDGDGFGDLAIGSPGDDTNGTDAGLVEVRSGRNGLLMRTHLGVGPAAEAGRLVVAMGDVDGDGRPEYAFTSPSAPGDWPGWVGSVHVISGATGQLLHRITDGMQGFARHLAAAGDLNNDGHADIIAGGPNGARIWSGAPGLALLVGSVLGDPIGVMDTTGNGAREYLSGVWLSELPGTVVSTLNPGFPPNIVIGRLPAGDIDRDGLPDICFWTPDWPGSGGKWEIYGTGIASGVGPVPGRAKLVSCGDDYDGDGWPDIAEAMAIGAAATNTIKVISGRTALPLHTIQLPGSCVAIAGPGKIMPGTGSCVVSTWWNGANETVYIHTGVDTTLAGRGTGSGWSPPRISCDPLVRGQISTVHGWRSAAGIGTLAISALPSQPTPLLGGDLWIDPASYALLDAFPLRPTYDQWAANFTSTPNDQAMTGDVNGDGRDDMVIWSAGNGRWEARISNGFRMTDTWVLPNHGVPGDRVFLADIDGNGAADAVAMTPANGDWRVAYANQYGWAPPVGLIGGFVPGQPDYLTGDVNGDGRDDIVAWNGGIYAAWYVGLSGPTGITVQAPWTFHGVGSTRRLLGDVNGDGKADSVAFYAATGTWTVSLSTGVNFVAPTTWASGHGVNSAIQLLADVDGGPGLDAVVIQNGFWWVERANPSQSVFSQPQSWMAGVGGAASGQLCGDVHGDGAADAVMYYANSGNGFVEVAPSLSPYGLPTFMSPGYSSFGYPLSVPNNSGLLGVSVVLQEFFFPSTQPLADITNGIVAVIR